MKRANKYLYCYVVQGFYDRWEDLCCSESRKEARDNLKDYRINAPYTAYYRIIYRRILNNAEQ
jgi:hypothetical protein